jgi:cobalt-zinc-cadmium efflux system protein
LIALVAGHFSTRPASQFATFGLIRSEIIGALFNGLFLLLMAVYVLQHRILK